MENNHELIKECSGDIIMSICFLGNTCVALSILNYYYIDEDYDNLYNIINTIAYFSLAYPYYILYTKYIKFNVK
jgi:hypothetical protein